MGKEILNISCPDCGSPAKFDIVHQIYRCAFCGGKVEIEEARQEKLDYKEKQIKRLRESAKTYPMSAANCTGCGAGLIFEKDEVISNCSFCGRSLVRTEYAFDENVPQNIIPFAVTKDEAEKLMLKWCDENKHKPEAKNIRKRIKNLKGFYLPYEMVRGPVGCRVSQLDATNEFYAEGYLNDEFVNCSSQLDNMVLDSMEPYNLDDLKEFDFSYVAGQKIKIPDIDEEKKKKRLNSEISENYRGEMSKVWGTKNVRIISEVDTVINVPVLLPAYYISDKKVKAAVNGQTGKVSVRAEKDVKSIAFPWWVGGLVTFIAVCVGIYFISMLAGAKQMEALAGTGMVGFLYVIIFFAMFDSSENNWFSEKWYINIFTSGEQLYKRENGMLVLREDIVKRKLEKPVFKFNIDGKEQVVTFAFRYFPRVLSMIMKGIFVIFLPVIIALIINGFDFNRLYLQGSGFWFFLAVPLVPVFFVQIGIKGLYEVPWIYIVDEKGNKKRYKEKHEVDVEGIVKTIMSALFSFPICFATWFAIFAVVMTIYYTAFGVD